MRRPRRVMDREQRLIAQTVRATLHNNGVVMTRRGPVGPEQIEKAVLAGATREEAINALARRAAEGDPE